VRLDSHFVQDILDNPVQIQFHLFPEIDEDRACMEVCLALNRFIYQSQMKNYYHEQMATS